MSCFSLAVACAKALRLKSLRDDQRVHVIADYRFTTGRMLEVGCVFICPEKAGIGYDFDA